MANSSDRISVLKNEINSILISAGAEITLRQLEVDYRDLIGKAIPYREVGHTSLEELVLSMPDAVMARWWNGDLKLRAITNLSNEHVASLINRTKKIPKTSYRPNKRSLLRPYQKSLLRPYQQPSLSNMMTRNNMGSVKTTNGTTTTTATSSSSNADYNMLRGEIRNLMFGYRYGLIGSKFADAFAKRYGNYRKLSDSGFPSILALLQSMPDVVDIEFHGNSTDFTARGKLGQKISNGILMNHVSHGGFPYHSNGVTTNGLQEQKKNYNDINVIPEVPSTLDQYVNGERNQNQAAEMLDDDDDDHEDDHEGSGDLDQEIDKKVTGDVESNIQKVLAIHPNGLYASKFIAEYKKLHGTELVVKKLGYQTVIELLAELTDIAVVERPANGDWLVFDKRTYRKELINRVLQSRGEYLPPTPTLFDFRHSLERVLENKPDGVQLKDLESIYEKSVHQSMNPRQMGFQNLDRLLESVSDMAEVEYKGAGRVMVKLVRTSHNLCRGNQMNGNADLSLAPYLPTTQQRNSPKDVVVDDGHCYETQEPPAPSAEYIEVIVSEVRNPSHFWFQLKTKKSPLEHLMDRLQTFYRDHAKDFAIPCTMLKVDLACVGQYPANQEWHRCLILDLKDEFAKVSYVDYGTEGFVDKNSVCFITSPFLSALPAQAIGGRLSKLAPIGRDWTEDASVCFFNLVRDRELVARITDISKEAPFTVSLFLCDTSHREYEDDFHINDYLIDEQHAILSIRDSQVNDADVEEAVEAPAATKHIAYTYVEEDSHVNDADVEETVEAPAVDAATKYIAYTYVEDDEDDDEYEFSSSESESETEQKVVCSKETAVAAASETLVDRATEAACVSGHETACASGHETACASGHETACASGHEEACASDHEIACASGHLFKLVQLTPEYNFHLINIDEKAYIISSEVSSFFWEEDLIRPLLRNQGRANVSKLVLTEDEHGEILQELFDAKLPGTSRNGVPSQMVVLYELSSVVEILELFNHSSEELKLAVQQQRDLFNSQDSYWTGKRELETDMRSSDLEQDLQQTRTDLRKKRECALRQMQQSASFGETSRLVEEIEDIEEKLETLDIRLEQLTDRGSASVLSFGSSKVPSLDRVVLQQDRRLDVEQSIAESSAPAPCSVGNNFLGRSSLTSRSFPSTANEETSYAVANSSAHFPTLSLPVASVGVSNLGANSAPSLSVPYQTSLSSLPGHSYGIYSQSPLNYDFVNMPPSSMAASGIQTQAPGFGAAGSLRLGSGATSLTFSADYQAPFNNGLVSNLPLLLNNSSMPGFNPLPYNPMLLGSMPCHSADPCYLPGPYLANGLLTTPGLLPSLSMCTRLASGGYPNGLALPNTFFAGNPNMQNMPH